MVDPVSIEVATAVAKVLAQWVTSRALDEVSLGRDFKNQLEKLNKKFGYIQAFLDDVSRNYSANNSENSSLVNLWLQNVKDAAYKADDVMDEYAVEIFRRRIEARNPMEEFFNNFFKPSNHVLFHFNMAHKVKDILSLLDEVNKDACDIGLNKVDFAASSSWTHSHHRHLSRTRQLEIVNASEYVGRGIHQEKLLDFICCPPDEPHLSTVAIVGMGGVGKTTLTRHLYNHERVRANFGSNKILICVSLKFNVHNILNEMIESRTSSKLDLTNTDALERELRKELSGKKLFLVLDDVWEDDHHSWKSLKEWLHQIEIARGSVILINTRSDQVLKAARPEFNLKLRRLSKAKSWSLLHQIVVNDSICSIDENMEEVGKRIVEKCMGVPLAIKAIGALLQSKHRLREWETIVKSELWELPCGQNQIFSSLLLSFNRLSSSSLKQCFAYCAILPKGFLVSKIELIGLWLSQGYICEEIGEENLEILLSNSLLERVSIGHGFVGYKMHDLLYGLAVFVCGGDLIKKMKDPGEIDNCRHLVISSTDDTAMEDLLHVRSSLRSLKISRCPMLIKIPSGLQECTSLWGLLLDDSHLLNEGSPINISELRLLLSLSIVCSSAQHLRSVLESARDHQVLGHVYIKGFKNEVEMEAYFSDMTPFRHLPSLRQLRLDGHPNIKTLPLKLHMHSNIKCLRIHEFEDLEEIPAWICNLSLRYLKLTNCENLKYLPSKKVLKHLFSLEIWGCPMLTKRYAKDGGPEWQSISHVRMIIFDYVVTHPNDKKEG